MANSGRLPGWVLTWFYATAAICTWDASFIILRPLTLPGGSLSAFFYPYKYYIALDGRYKDVDDAYVYAQSLLNYVEVIINIITIILHYKRSKHTVRLAFTVTVMTFWKTVLYFLMFTEFCGAGHYRVGNSPIEEFFLVVIPNGFWIVVPFLIMIKLWDVDENAKKLY